jgi:2'-5' RNA ligase
MIRLFVALELPLPVRDALLAMMGGVAGARWQTDEQLHLTLRFIGDVDRHQAADIAAALDHVHMQPLRLTLGEVGSFDRRGRIDTLWVGVTPREQVAALARKVDQALTLVNIQPETRQFLPHITLAHLGRDSGSTSGFPARAIPALSFDINGFTLWESQLGASGSTYTVLDRYN